MNLIYCVLNNTKEFSVYRAPFQSPFTTHWGYGGRILDLNPGVLMGEDADTALNNLT